jgi:hypothetical protein
MTDEEIQQCQLDWQCIEMADLDRSHLKSCRLELYRKWFLKLLLHVQNEQESETP